MIVYYNIDENISVIFIENYVQKCLNYSRNR